MSDKPLAGKKIAILVADGFEQVELTGPREALDAAGADTSILSLKPGNVRAWKFTEWGEQFPVDMVVERADPAAFDALLLPGGVINPDVLRMSQTAMAFVRHFFDANKPVASICHGPWSIVEVGAARGRRMTSWPSIRTDLRNAGAEVVDEAAVVDRNMVTSRGPQDIPVFNREMVALFAKRKTGRPAKRGLRREAVIRRVSVQRLRPTHTVLDRSQVGCGQASESRVKRRLSTARS